MRDLDLQRKLTTFLVASNMIIEAADHPTAKPTKQTKEIQDKARELQELVIPIVDKIYSHREVQKTIVFSTIQNKIEYVINKEIK